MWVEIPVFLFLLFSLLLLPYGYNCLVLAYGSYKYKQPTIGNLNDFPHVTIQIPVYNERHIVEDLLNAVSNLDWPKNKLDIMILDDSSDETQQITENEAKRLNEKGIATEVIRRKIRAGFKAGALNNALSQTIGEYIAVLDADFVPDSDFLKKTIPYLVNEQNVAFVQTRWGHLNRDQNRFTEAFSIALDSHHLVDQAGRYSLGFFISFNGSAGVLRTKAIRDVGGWMSDTISEDLDISFRLQLEGWRGVYLRDVITHGLVPSTLAAFRTQQSRWAKGSIQCARKHLGGVWENSEIGFFQKVQASIQLTNYSISLLMLMLVIMEVIMMGVDFILKPDLILGTYLGQVLMDPRLGVLFVFCTLSTYAYYYTALNAQGISIRSKLGYLGLLALIGHGFSAICGVSILEGVFTRNVVFERVPKFSALELISGFRSDHGGNLIRFRGLEFKLAICSAMGLCFAYLVNLLPTASYLFVYLAGFLIVFYNLE